ncbi:hypothetical protein Tco_0670525 [Tanacetum coccineum]
MDWDPLMFKLNMRGNVEVYVPLFVEYKRTNNNDMELKVTREDFGVHKLEHKPCMAAVLLCKPGGDCGKDGLWLDWRLVCMDLERRGLGGGDSINGVVGLVSEVMREWGWHGIGSLRELWWLGICFKTAEHRDAYVTENGKGYDMDGIGLYAWGWSGWVVGGSLTGCLVTRMVGNMAGSEIVWDGLGNVVNGACVLGFGEIYDAVNCGEWVSFGPWRLIVSWVVGSGRLRSGGLGLVVGENAKNVGGVKGLGCGSEVLWGGGASLGGACWRGCEGVGLCGLFGIVLAGWVIEIMGVLEFYACYVDGGVRWFWFEAESLMPNGVFSWLTEHKTDWHIFFSLSSLLTSPHPNSVRRLFGRCGDDGDGAQ